MPTIDVYIDDERRRKRRRGKWLLPLLVGLIAALALGREKPRVAPPPVAPPPPITNTVVNTATTVTIEPPPGNDTATTTSEPLPPALPAHLVVRPARLEFGDGPLARGVPAQMAIIRNDGGQPLPRVAVTADKAFLATNGCVGELPPGSECAIAVVFAPPTSGKFAGSLTIAAGGEKARIRLGGSVAPPPRVNMPVTPVPTTHVAGTTTSPVPPPPPPPPPARTLCFQPALLHFTSTGKQTITLTNPEPVPLRVVAVLPIGRQGQTVSGYEIEARRCLRVMKPGQQCKFTIRANELALQTHETMQLTVYYDDPVTGGRRAAQFNSACGR